MRTSRIALFAPLVLFGCDCGEELQVLAPKIVIGDPYDATFSVCQTDLVKDCAYDFGEVGIGRPKNFSFAIKNPTQVDLQIISITIEGPQTFTLEGTLPTEVSAANGTAGEIVTVKYSPLVETVENARIIIDTNAQNLLADENVVIELTASGKELGSPVIAIEPGACDFGDVGVGVRGVCQLSIKNEGNMELEVSDMGFSPSTPTNVFANDGPFIIPAYVAPGTAVSVSFQAIPNAPNEITGELIVSSNDPVNPQVTVPFVVRGAQAPTAVGRVKSINGIANSSATPAIEPLDNVVVSGDESVGAGGAVIIAYQWDLIEQPAESSVVLSDPTSMDTGFEFSSASGTVNGLDVAGTFVVRLTVTDSNGGVSTNDARVTMNSVPTEGFHVQLSWASDDSDIDLHVGRGNNPDWCSQDDCYYSNCTGLFGGGLDWDGGGSGDAGDPTLDIDDVNGFGPENTNIESPENGSYVIAVDAYSLDSPTDLTVKIFLGGALAAEVTTHVDGTHDFWKVARVDVNGGSTVTILDTQTNNWNCSMP